MSAPQPWPDALDDIWAKSPASGEARGETLAEHTWQVLQRLGDLRRLRPSLDQSLGEPELWSRLFWACLLHDLGKCAPGFQHKLRPGMRDSALAKAWASHHHEVMSLAFVDWVFPGSSEARNWVIAGIASHHRDHDVIEQAYPLEAEPQLREIIASIQADVVGRIYDWLSACAEPWAGALGIHIAPTAPVMPKPDAVKHVTRSGAPAILRALKDYTCWSRALDPRWQPTTAQLLLRGLITQSDHTASARAGVIRGLSCTADGLRQKWSHIAQYNAHQEHSARVTGSALLVAPTGSGKTEAALLWASAQRGAPRLFYALPYQASMNAMWRRLCSAFEPRDVQLQHGRALLALYRLLMEAEPDPAKAARQARWRRNLVRLHHAPVQVFSPYQMLKAMFRLKGYEGMLTDFYGAAFIFDEVHAYEPGRLAMIVETMRHLREHYAARFFVMSATFPTLIRDKLEDALGNPAFIQAAPALYRDYCRHRLHVVEGDLLDSQHWLCIVQAAREGNSVLVCVNTVARAQEAFRRMRSDLPEAQVILLHGRFNMRDRSARERRIRLAVGAHNAQRRPVVLIATQVVEVSLDIDLDILFTDPAPLEALVQRFGRINRRRRIRPTAPVYVFAQPVVNGRPYAAPLVDAALCVLRREHGNDIPEDRIGAWLDEIYVGEIRNGWLKAYEGARAEFLAACVQTLRPFRGDDAIEERFYEAFDGVEVLPQSLADEYAEFRETRPVLAQELFVPIRYGQLIQIERAGRLKRRAHPTIVDVPYFGGEDGIGLDLSALRAKPSP
ncbi:MAG: CRISPR-associated helicase/endonuclease Cas3 [Candidatus Roseilinea sp.]|nr:MAG: CRISPR-associated helicase/endonuclease Cas3 [Candidatus Roseilinea sp.]